MNISGLHTTMKPPVILIQNGHTQQRKIRFGLQGSWELMHKYSNYFAWEGHLREDNQYPANVMLNIWQCYGRKMTGSLVHWPHITPKSSHRVQFITRLHLAVVCVSAGVPDCWNVSSLPPFHKLTTFFSNSTLVVKSHTRTMDKTCAAKISFLMETNRWSFNNTTINTHFWYRSRNMH